MGLVCRLDSRGVTQIDWEASEELVKELTTPEIESRLEYILSKLEEYDKYDRETGSDHGGFYRDCCSIYRKEINRRLTYGVVCPTCGR